MSNARNIANLPNGDDAPIYACRAWVNFRGSSQSGTLNTSGPVTGLYTATVTSATTFTIEYSSTTYTVTTSGNHDVGDGEGVDLTISGTSVTIDTQIRGSGNVSGITENGGSGDYTVNFATAMPDGNYAICGSAIGYDATIANLAQYTGHIQPRSTSDTTASSLRFIVSRNTTGTEADEGFDSKMISVAILR